MTFYEAVIIPVKQKKGRGFSHDPFKTKKGPQAYGVAHDPLFI